MLRKLPKIRLGTGKLNSLNPGAWNILPKNTFCCTFHCILPVFTPWYTTILLLLPTLFCIDVIAIHVLSICHQDMWKNYWDFLVDWISTIFLHIFSNRLRFWGSGSLVVSSHNAMVEAESNLKLLPPFILDICKVFECIGMLSTVIQ